MYESNKVRAPPSRWDRKLTEPEWDYYVKRYSNVMKVEAEAVQHRIQEESLIANQNTVDVMEKWKTHVAPLLQTDMEHNVAEMKKKAKKHAAQGTSPAPPDLRQYRLFAAPQMQEMGQQAVDALRRKETANLEKWWEKRREQLKPPK
jgi:hypothetical protein